jgi:uncharacterized XkdX family phage protein
MSWFDRIKMLYQRGLWTAQQVQDAVTAGRITAQQAQEILE